MSWSSKQRLSPKDLAYLQDVLLELSLKLEKQSASPLDSITNTNFGDMTQNISTRSMLANIFTNLGKD